VLSAENPANENFISYSFPAVKSYINGSLIVIGAAFVEENVKVWKLSAVAI